MVGDKILEVEGRKVLTIDDLNYAFRGVEDGSLDFVVERNGQKTKLNDVQFKTSQAQGISYIDLDFYVKGVEKNFFTFIEYTFKTAIFLCKAVWLSFIDLITGKYGISAISGPVGITAAIGSIAKENLFNTLPILALITINLGIFNLFPIPALDGGRTLMILIEMITRKKIPAKIEQTINAVGLMVLLGLSAIIMVKDIFGLFT
jgi:regulator of sigma E protease